jgi:hypothetical protein
VQAAAYVFPRSCDRRNRSPGSDGPSLWRWRDWRGLWPAIIYFTLAVISAAFVKRRHSHMAEKLNASSCRPSLAAAPAAIRGGRPDRAGCRRQHHRDPGCA